MPYRPTTAPANLDTDGLRKFTEEQLRRVQRATDEIIQAADALTTRVTANEARLAKLENNQFSRVYLSGANQAITAGVATKIQFNSKNFDASNIFDLVNFRYKPTVAGYYRLAWGCQITSGSSTFYYSSLYLNGTRYAIGSLVSEATATENAANTNGTTIAYFNGSSNYAEVFAYANGGASPAVTQASDQTWFDINLIKAD